MHDWRNLKLISITPLLLILLFAVACGAATTPIPQATDVPSSSSESVAPTIALPSGATSGDQPTAPTAQPEPSAVPPATGGEPVQRDLRVAITPPYAENLLGFIVGGTNQGILQPMQENLIQRNFETWEAQPMLATDWAMAPNGRDWRFNLREGVSFHNGDEFDATDVIFSWQLWTHPEGKGGYNSLWDTLLGPAGDERSFDVETLGTAAQVEVITDHEIVFHLARPELNLLAFTSDAFTDPLIYNLAHWDEVGEAGYGENPVGTGPWKFVEYNAGSSLRYERVDYDHWRVTPDFETLTYVFAPEDVTRLAMLLTGEADIVEIPRELQQEVLKKNMAMMRSTLPAFMVWIAIGGQYLEDKRDPNDPNTDPLVRDAMNLAINREQLNDAFFAGKMELMANTGWHPSDPTYNPEWTIPEYNPERARELLLQAGYTADAGPTVTFMAANLVGVPELKELGVPMAQMMKDVGINVELEVGEFAPIRQGYKAREMQNTLWTHRTGFWPSWRNQLVYFVSPALDGAVFQFEDPYTEERYGRFLNSIDVEERSNIMTEIGDFMRAQNATIPLGFLFGEFGVNPEVIAEYSVNNSYFGAMKGHEYTKVVRK